MVLSDFGGATFVKFIDGLNAIGGSSTKIHPSILPPEMIASVNLSHKGSFDRFMKYWSHVHTDAKYLRALTPEERESISHYVGSYKTPSDNQSSKTVVGSWKSDISSLLESIRFEDLPPFLAKCNTFGQFCMIWTRMCENLNIWEYTLRPHYSDDHCAYIVKSFENRIGSPPRDVSSLPYKLVPPSEKIDVWNFGIFMYELLSGGTPFHSGYRGDLRGAENYSRLYKWSRSDAEKSVKEHVADPLAQDLLCKILLPADERLPTLSAVLKHLYFSPKSQESERFLEKVSPVTFFLHSSLCFAKRIIDFFSLRIIFFLVLRIARGNATTSRQYNICSQSEYGIIALAR
jgi:serine/threonine protein kinase